MTNFLQSVRWLLLLVCVQASAQTSPPDPVQLLDRMSRAASMLNFDGDFIYISGHQVDSMRIIHKANENGEFERLVSQTGAAREVIRDKETVTCIFPDNRAGMMEERSPGKIFPDLHAAKLNKMSAFYHFKLEGRDRVAGRDVWVVAIIPKGGHRYGYRFWVDQETSLLLRSILLDNNNRVLEHIMFTNIKYPSEISDRQLMPALSGKGYTWHLDDSNVEPSKRSEIGWDVAWLPAGFSMQDHAVQRFSTSDMPVDHMVYTDGLATISVFVEKIMDPKDVMIGYSVQGAINTYSALSNGYQITVVGEVPPKTVKQIADSLNMIR